MDVGGGGDGEVGRREKVGRIGIFLQTQNLKPKN
jgi:hypothetical protein